MAFKILAGLICCLVLVLVKAAPYHHEQGGSSHASFHLVSHDDHHDHHDDGHDSHAEYEFKYGVEDKKTGDNKSQGEKRDGHKVTGFYELIDADGYKRTVHYTADKHSGFQAVVHRVPIPHFVVDHSHTSYYGGYAQADEHHEHKGHDHGYASGWSLKQEHAVPYHHKGH